HPTTAGVLASFASLGDVIVAEPGALLAFTGPRVVQQTTREKLPEDFGLAEQNLRFGHIDAIVPRPELKSYVARLLRLFSPNGDRRRAEAARAAHAPPQSQPARGRSRLGRAREAAAPARADPGRADG